MWVLDFISSFIENIVLIYVMGKILKYPIPYKRKSYWLVLLAITILNTIVKYEWLNIINTVSYTAIQTITPFLGFYLMVYILYLNKKRYLAIGFTIYLSVYYIIVQLATLTVMQLTVFQLISANNIVIIYITSFIVYINIFYIKSFNADYFFYIWDKITMLFTNIKKKSHIHIIYYVFYLIINLAVVLYMVNVVERDLSLVLGLVAVQGLFLILESLKLFKTVSKNNTEIAIEMQKGTMESYDEILKDVKGFWHSYTNIMTSVSMVVDDSYSVDKECNREDLKNMFNEFMDWEKVNSYEEKIRLLDIPHVGIAGIVSKKVKEARELGLDVDIKISKQENNLIKPIKINMIELVEIIGILLDNAIQAGYFVKEEKMKIYLSFYGSSFDFIVENYYKKDGKGNILTNHKSNGIGIGRVETIENKYNSMKYIKAIKDIDSEKGVYKAIIEILEALE